MKVLPTKILLSKIKRRVLRYGWILRLGTILLLAFLAILVFYSLSTFIRRTKISFYLDLARSFIFTPDSQIKPIAGRTNILILGKSGEGHDSPQLTDSIIFVSLDHRKKNIIMISLPRDIWLPELRAKLNSVYYWGNQKERGGGLILAKATVEKILGEPVQYGFVIDFRGFVRTIDILGGINVEVERAFTDEKYPVAGRENDKCGGDPNLKCRYETVHFDKGWQHMDGETALKFVRSRNAQGDEGTDLARAARQQKVIAAVREKFFTWRTILSPKKLLALRQELSKNSETDLPPTGLAVLARRILQAKDNLNSYVLPEDLLINPPISPLYDNLYVFVPRGDGWEEIQTWVDNLLGKTD